MKKKKGISLIVLVITIIIMIILAGAIILTLNNSGIINKAQDAVDATNEATVEEMAQLAWAESYANNARTEDELKTAVLNALNKNKVKVDDYVIKVTTSGVTVKAKKNIWVKEGFTVVKGDQVLEIGDVVNYDDGVSGYTAGWKVLGADEEGNLLIMSAGDVKTEFILGDESTSNIEAAIEDMETGEAQLNAECEPYGHGTGVVGVARSITVEDVNSVTGYDPTTYGQGTVTQYGNIVTYKYNGTTKPAYESVVERGTLSFGHSNGFYYYNGEKVAHINDLTSGTNGNIFATLTSNYYIYDALELTTISSSENEKAYSMIFGSDDTCYWLASPFVKAGTSYASFGMRGVGGGCVDNHYLFLSIGYAYRDDIGVRAVVALSSDITFVGSSESGWSY